MTGHRILPRRGNAARTHLSRPLLVVLLALFHHSTAAQLPPARNGNEDVRSTSVRSRPGLTPNGDLLFNGWGVTPAGEHVPISDMALKFVISPDKKMLLAANGGFNDTGLTVFDLAAKRVSQFLPLPEVWNGLAFSKDGHRIFVSGGDSGEIHVFTYENGKAIHGKPVKPAPDALATVLGGIIVHPATGKLYVCNEGNHEVWMLDPDTLALEAKIGVGQHPHSCAMGADQRHLYVSNWGSRSVSLIDTKTNLRVRDFTVGLRPNDMALGPDGRLFVACAGDNTVHVIQTETLEESPIPAGPARRLWDRTREIISTSLYPQSPEGSTPTAVAVSTDGKTLFIANSDNNCVMVVDVSNPNVSVANGFIPVGWYPTAVAVSPDDQTLFVANGKGLASRANVPPKKSDPRRLHKPPPFDYIGRTFQGAISIIARPDAAQMAGYTEQVRRNSPYTPDALRRVSLKSNGIIPDQVGQPCPIRYVLYIIKENRTYDQVFGAFKDAKGRPAGNGDPDLVMFGEDVAPNHHQLAREYVLLDNLYCNGEVSVDGHSWCDAAIATDFNQRSWIMSYSRHGRLPGNEEMENPAAGYLWDLCRRHGISYRNYGEGAQRVPSINRGKWVGDRDMDKVQCWIDDLHAAEKSGELPRFTIMSLGEDHTRGTTPGSFTPDACVASNDIGLGKIVEAASRSRFWKEMAIFVIEDDAQNGPDHVDAHRTVGFVISPWCKRGFVDSTLYTTASMVRTMELILGLPPLTQYDAGATPMFNSFRKSARLTAYQPLAPKVNLHTRNTEKSPFAKESRQMDWSEYDRIPEDELNRILWYVTKGPDVPYPAPIHRAVFTK
jgi:YVTN family beta-propeller protein